MGEIVIPDNMKPIPCKNEECDNPNIALANCDKIGFVFGDYISTIQFKRASYIEVQCGKCAEKTVVRNPQRRR
jgi:hypothetical protein